MNVICIHPRLGGLTSHHFNEAQGFIEEFRRRGTMFELLVSAHAPAAIAAELDAHAVVDDPTFRLEWSFDERSRRFVAMLHDHVDARSGESDCVLITVSTQVEAHALTRWLAELPSQRKPWVVILFLSDRWNRSGQPEYERQIAEFRKLRAAISSLSAADAARMIFFTVTDALAAELTGLLGTAVRVAPMPLAYPEPLVTAAAKLPSARPRVAVLGGMRAEKGSHLIPGIIRACRERVPVDFLVQLANNTLTADEVNRLARIADEPHVTVIDRPMTRPEYYSAVASADLGLFPYEVIPYRRRTSGVFGEMVALAKPVVATRGTWLAEQIDAGRAAGTIFNDLEPGSIADAIATSASELEPLTRSAQALSSEWRRTVSLSAFVDLMETTIAARSAAERPADKLARSFGRWMRRRLARASTRRGEDSH
jgi:glycosyltransferase involved in cell wall biosynthesis